MSQLVHVLCCSSALAESPFFGLGRPKEAFFGGQLFFVCLETGDRAANICESNLNCEILMNRSLTSNRPGKPPTGALLILLRHTRFTKVYLDFGLVADVPLQAQCCGEDSFLEEMT